MVRPKKEGSVKKGKGRTFEGKGGGASVILLSGGKKKPSRENGPASLNSGRELLMREKVRKKTFSEKKGGGK